MVGSWLAPSLAQGACLATEMPSGGQVARFLGLTKNGDRTQTVLFPFFVGQSPTRDAGVFCGGSFPMFPPLCSPHRDAIRLVGRTRAVARLAPGRPESFFFSPRFLL